MDVRSCDICGALNDPSQPEIGRGTFFVLKRMPPEHPIMQMFESPQEAPHAKYDLCPGCTAQFVAMIATRRTLSF